MTEFTQDKIFKNTIETDAAILFDEFGVSTEMIRFWTKELRLLDPKDYRPDIILELDDRNLIVELQSTKVDDEFSARGLTYVSVANRVKKNSKQMDLMVISSTESSKIIYYQYNDKNVFVYEVKGLQDMDAEQIINNVELKINSNKEISSQDLVRYSLLPLIDPANMISHIERVMDTLIELEDLSISLKSLS